MLTKDQLPIEIATERTLVRRAVADDLEQISAWPDYRGLWRSLSMTAQSQQGADARRWWERIDEADRCHYTVVLPASGEVIGVHAFVRIDWPKAVTDNMGVRIRADLCGQGYGTETLLPLLEAALTVGMTSIRLDVAATNPRAVRCYQKCGMCIVDEFWNEHKSEPIDPADPKWTLLMPHLRQEAGKWMVRFYWMSICREGNSRE